MASRSNLKATSVDGVVHRPSLPWQWNLTAREDWVMERWGGFLCLVISRNENFMLDFKDGNLWLQYENDSRDSPVGRVLLLETPTRQGIVDAEQMFGCK